ncbi:SixA phosphatase family protein [Enterovibrio coralii]|uniref:Phosphohistidine phosphatase n=1 Tax=Enterovibrio coralii TaxID=294935 RepID=A0A135IAG1_9GAMM|nr:histidine phosphatase family protein [Enterovibrio coralii]KXF82427.1 hypothetical protein ATN88_09915 [Enterovibrio coralii]
MKLLFLVRHAKSCWKDASLDDHDRPLNPRGLKNAPEMGLRLAAWQWSPELIVSSTALRAKETARLVSEQLSGTDLSILHNKDVYTENWHDLVAIIEGFDDDVNRIMLVGHNPAFNDLINDVPFELENLPTCGVAAIAMFDTSWSNWSSAKKELLFLDYPKRLSSPR